MNVFLSAVLTASLLAGASALAGHSTSLPSLQPVLQDTRWYNGRADAASLKGKVVVVDVFTVDCINCQNVTPELRKLHASDARRGLAVIGVHTPETSWEKNPRHVAAGLAQLGVTWPVAIDDDRRIWNAYGVSAWPTQLIFDRHGVLRATIVGDSQDAQVERVVNGLLSQR
ncbi:MAG TPA: redoxin family protein [Candidatus Baltobacteraceae bacterium]|jgi:thiol-disulfide isomerase/thioredoxin